MALNFVATNTPIANCNPGSIIKMEATVAAATVADAGPHRVVLMLYGPSGQVYEQIMWNAGPVSTTPLMVACNYKLSATLPAGEYSSRVSVRDARWAWQSVSQTPAAFKVPVPAWRMPLYGMHSKFPPLLKPAGAGDPLDGVGFLPDTGDSFTLVINDEFNGSTLDTAKWWRRYKDYSGTLDHYNDELQRYGDNHIVKDGMLNLTAKVRPGTVGHAPSGSNIYPIFDSCVIRSRPTFKYGYVESRIKNPPGYGVWTAFWILAQGAGPCEIDIMEYVRNGVTEFPNMVHGGNVHQVPGGAVRWAERNSNTQYSFWRAPSNLSPTYFVDDYHVYGLLWEPDLITAYVDGFPVVQRHCEWKYGSLDGGLASVIVNLAIGGGWPTYNWTTPVAMDDQVMMVDYVRVYQKSGSIITGVSPL